MLRILRAFAWMRWRILMNSLQKVSARDTVQRFSLAIEPLMPVMVTVLMIPSMIALAGLGAFTGFELITRGDDSFVFQIVRYVLFGAVAFSVVGPIVLPGADRSNPVRLLLLPIPARTLYVAHAAGSLGDIWIVLMIPILLGLPFGLLAGGAAAPAVLALIAGTLMVLILVGLSALGTTLMHLLLRNRRRGELLALVMILVISFSGFVPAFLGSRRRRREGTSRLPAWAVVTGASVFALLPSEIYTTINVRAVGTGIAAAALPLMALLLGAAGIHGIGLVLFRRVLSAPGSSTSRSSVSASGMWSRRLPGVSAETSAVALALFRLVLRTPRGRSILLGPVLAGLFFAFLTRPGGAIGSGPAFAAMGALFSLLSTMPVALNQFAVDGAGLTLTLLSPLSTRRLLIGKAIGSALVAVLPALVCMGLGAIVLPDNRLGLWLAVPLSFVTTMAFVAPLNAFLSAVFPRVVDMNSIGRGSNAHTVAGVLGMLAVLAAGASCALLAWAAAAIDRPWLAPVFLLIWSAVGLAAARILFIPAERVFDARRESLAMMLGREA